MSFNYILDNTFVFYFIFGSDLVLYVIKCQYSNYFYQNNNQKL